MLDLILSFAKSNAGVLGVLGGIIGYLVVRFKSLQTDTLKSALQIATEQKTDATLQQKQTDIEQQIQEASKPVVNPTLTPDEAIKKLDQI